LAASTTEFEPKEAEVMESVIQSEMLQEDQVMESVIHSEMFREELQEMVAQQITDTLQQQQPSSQPLYDLISLRQRYGQPDENRKFGMWLNCFWIVFHKAFISPVKCPAPTFFRESCPDFVKIGSLNSNRKYWCMSLQVRDDSVF